MNSIVHEKGVEPIAAKVTSHSVTVELKDGRTIITPLNWYPRLMHGTPAEWKRFELSPFGVHWPDLNEDLSIEGMLEGRKSGESASSFKRWLGYRARGEKEPILELPMPAWAAEHSKRPVSAKRQKHRMTGRAKREKTSSR